ncbi:MAG TPA: hypothetical protein VLI65_09430, partial [Pyrinomonadaceae bacterium]|nr:hypothetical protein [Pyrinomonadaceae bacterium]
MSSHTTDISDRWDPEPRWPALIAIFAVAGLYIALPRSLVFGPKWLYVLLIGILLVPTIVFHRTRFHKMDRVLGFTISGLITIAMIASVVLLISGLSAHAETPSELLFSAGTLWSTNILVFS